MQDPPALDANYIRRSDAELFWKEWAAAGNPHPPALQQRARGGGQDLETSGSRLLSMAMYESIWLISMSRGLSSIE